MNRTILATAVASILTPALFTTLHAKTTNFSSINQNSGNWKGSVIIEGNYIDRSNNAELEIPGMPSGGHAHGLDEGLQFGHSELVVTGDINDHISARFTAAIIQAAEEEEDGIEAELEEAFIETQALGNGLGLKAGRFFSNVGYLSSKHNHEADFADQPLVYEGMFGEHAIGDGLQLNYLANTDTFLQFGSELFFDEEFPSGKTKGAISSVALNAKVGGDFGTDHSWLAGIGHWRADNITDRSGGAHGHEGEEATETPRFSGDSQINTINALYKWAPSGNAKDRNLKLQAEYFQRKEKGRVDMVEADGSFEETTSYDGTQSGWYAQAIYQFRPQWRVGIRHDHLNIRNTGSDEEILEEAELLSSGHTPKRNSIMLDYSPREYSRLRLQFNRDERSENKDDQIILQYIHSFGAHGAHSF
ncbi:MAG: hypothetical protein ACI88H_003377 [Cocleimonas sp.]|jgi:hypothetical protein